MQLAWPDRIFEPRTKAVNNDIVVTMARVAANRPSVEQVLRTYLDAVAEPVQMELVIEPAERLRARPSWLGRSGSCRSLRNAASWARVT